MSAIRIRDYTLEPRIVGTGGFGMVVKGHRSSDPSQKVAVKVVSLKKVKLSTVQQEVDIIAILQHPNIVDVIEDFQLGSAYYIVQELLEGGDLYERLKETSNCSEEELRPCFAQLMDAVNHCHANGVVHRDIKLENILIQERTCTAGPTLKLCDFGLAVLLPRMADGSVLADTPLHGIVGSRAYVAPEVLSGESYNGPKSDIWNCGVCLFAMLNRYFPFEEATPHDWRFARGMQAHTRGHSLVRTIHGFYKKPIKITDDAIELLDGMLTIDPRRRFSMGEILHSAFLDSNKPAPPPQLPAGGGGGVGVLTPAMKRWQQNTAWQRIGG